MLSPRFIGPYEMIEKVGPMAYHLALPPELEKIHNLFHVYMLRNQILAFQQALSNFSILIPSVSQVFGKFPTVLFHSFVVDPIFSLAIPSL